MRENPVPSDHSRPWRAIAQELITERNPERFTDLAEELNRALEEQFGNRTTVNSTFENPSTT